MKLLLNKRNGFTLVEVLIALATTAVVMGGTIGIYVYGLKMMQVTQPKLTASDEARRAVSLFTEDVRSAFSVAVGNRSGTAFVPVSPFSLQTGSALRIHPSNNTNEFVLYYWEAKDKTLRRATHNLGSIVVASSVSNSTIFAAEDFRGTIVSNYVDNHVISLTLQFYQLQYPRTPVAPGNYYDWYQLRSRVTRRTFF